MSFLLIVGSKYCWAHSDTSYKRCNSISGFGLLKKSSRKHSWRSSNVCHFICHFNKSEVSNLKKTKQSKSQTLLFSHATYHFMIRKKERHEWDICEFISSLFFFNYREAQICNMSSFVLHLILSSLTNHN